MQVIASQPSAAAVAGRVPPPATSRPVTAVAAAEIA
jgi:hypothetical protein